MQIAFCFLLYSLFPGFQPYAPDIDLTNVRDRVVGILFGLIVMTYVFQHMAGAGNRPVTGHFAASPSAAWQVAGRSRSGNPVNEARPKAEALIAEISRELEKARHQAEVMSLEFNEPQSRESISSGDLETMLSHAKHILTLATSLTSDSAWQEWQQMPPEAQAAESGLRNAVAKRLERAAAHEIASEADANLSLAFDRWNETIQRLSLGGGRVASIGQIAGEIRRVR